MVVKKLSNSINNNENSLTNINMNQLKVLEKLVDMSVPCLWVKIME